MSRTILFLNGYICIEKFQKDSVHEEAMFINGEQLSRMNVLAALLVTTKRTDATKLRGVSDSS